MPNASAVARTIRTQPAATLPPERCSRTAREARIAPAAQPEPHVVMAFMCGVVTKSLPGASPTLTLQHRATAFRKLTRSPRSGAMVPIACGRDEPTKRGDEESVEVIHNSDRELPR